MAKKQLKNMTKDEAKSEVKTNLIKYIDDNLDSMPEEIIGDVLRLRARIEIKLKNK